MTTLVILVCFGILGVAVSSHAPTPLHKQQTTTASKADSTCEFLGNPVGGNGGGEFADPCSDDITIVEIKIATGEFDGLKNCLRYIKTTYMHSDGSVYEIEHGESYYGAEINIVDLRNQWLVEASASSAVSDSGITVVNSISFETQSTEDYTYDNFGPYGGDENEVLIPTIGRIKAIAGHSGAAIDQISFQGKQGFRKK